MRIDNRSHSLYIGLVFHSALHQRMAVGIKTLIHCQRVYCLEEMLRNSSSVEGGGQDQPMYGQGRFNLE